MNFTRLFLILICLCAGKLIAQKPILKGKKIYEDNCLVCHQEDGSGVPGMNPPLIKTKWVLGEKNQLIQILVNGLNKPIEIEGETYQNPMPAQNHLSNDQIAAVLTYVRSSFGNKASPITVADVGRIRSSTKSK